MNILQETITQYDSPLVNNSKEIIRNKFRRWEKMGVKGAMFAQNELGVDADVSDGDFDGQSQKGE